MANVVAQERGYFDGLIREPGDGFHIPDEIWNDERRRPSWVKLAPFGGKGDHDRDGEPGGSRPAPATDDLDAMTKAQLVEYAKQHRISIDQSASKAEVLATIKANVETSPRGNGIQEALAATQPDWLPGGSQPI